MLPFFGMAPVIKTFWFLDCKIPVGEDSPQVLTDDLGRIFKVYIDTVFA